MKLVINRCFGGFGLSQEAIVRLREMGNKAALEPGSLKGERYDDGSISTLDDIHEIKRDDPDLVTVVEELGASADGSHAKLAIVYIPDNVEWSIEQYDGSEWVSEKHRTWS